MFLKRRTRRKDGKEHVYYSVCESLRVHRGRTLQRQVLHLGELNTRQHDSWEHTLDVLHEDGSRHQRRIFTDEEGTAPHAANDVVEVKLSTFAVKQPRRFGDCWVGCHAWEQLGLRGFWAEQLGEETGEVPWAKVLELLAVNRLLDPRSELYVHEKWFGQTAMDVLLDSDAAVAGKDRLYRCLDRIVAHKPELEKHLAAKWRDLFAATFDILLYDLTSTYFESPLPEDEKDKRRYGYSRDKRPDCVQVVIALVVTPEGFPLAYEVLAGNTADKTTLKLFLQTIEAHYGRAERVWVMDRGIPTEEVLAEMRAADPPVYYLVGTPRGRLTKLERDLLPLPWATVRPGVNVKLLPQDGELYVLAESRDRLHKERAMRWRRLKGLVKRLKQLQQMKLNDTRQLLLKLGEAKGRYRAAWRLIEIVLPHAEASSASPESAAPDTQVQPLFSFRLNRKKLREVRRREGRYLLRTNLCGHNPAELWQFYLQLTEVEAAFKNLKDDLQLRPLYHQLEHRIEAHIFVAFMAYCLHISLRARLKPLAPGLTSRAVLDKLAGIQMLDVHFPTTDGRTLILSRYTEPNPDQRLLLERLNLTLPPQPPPRITAAGQLVH